jgi:hypothetical protein
VASFNASSAALFFSPLAAARDALADAQLALANAEARTSADAVSARAVLDATPARMSELSELMALTHSALAATAHLSPESSSSSPRSAARARPARPSAESVGSGAAAADWSDLTARGLSPAGVVASMRRSLPREGKDALANADVLRLLGGVVGQAMEAGREKREAEDEARRVFTVVEEVERVRKIEERGAAAAVADAETRALFAETRALELECLLLASGGAEGGAGGGRAEGGALWAAELADVSVDNGDDFESVEATESESE